MIDIKKNIYIRLIEILFLLYSIFYCMDRKMPFLIPIYVVIFMGCVYFSKKIKCEASLIKVLYVFFCFHVIENDFYQIFSETNNKYIFLVCTILMFKSYNRSCEEYVNKSLISRFFVDFIVTCQCFGYVCSVIAKYKDVKVAVCIFCLLFFWCHVLVSTVLNIFFYSGKRLKCSKEGKKHLEVVHIWLILFGIVFGVGVLFSLAFYPGIITPDNIYFYEIALNGSLFGQSDIHSFAYLCVFKAIILLCKNYYIVTVLLMSFFAIAWASVFAYLCKKGLRAGVAVIITIGWLLFPSNIHMLIASWKDIPFTICLLVLSFQLLKNYFEDKYTDKISNLVTLSLTLFGVAVFRSNGQVVLLVMVIFYTVEFIRRNVKFKLLASILVSLISVLIFKGPVFNYFNVQQSPSNYSALPFMDGIVEYVYQGNALDYDTEQYFYSLTTYDTCMQYYTSYNLDIGMFNGGYGNFDMEKASMGYFKCFFKNPIATIAGRFKRTFNMWSIFYNEDFPISKFIYSDVWANGYGWQYNEKMKFLRDTLINLYSEDHLIGTIQAVFYRGGFNILLWICSLLYIPVEKRKIAYTLVPIIANTIGLFLGCCFPDYRYIYPMFVITVPYISAVLADVQLIKE